MKILIIKVSALGDVVHTLPVLPYIHSSSAECEIDWLVEESFAALLDGHPLINNVIPIQTKRWRQLSLLSMLAEVWKFTQRLRQKKYDLVFDLQGNSKSGLFTLLSRAQKKYGFTRAEVREWPNLLATNHKVTLLPAEHHVSQRSMAVVRSALPHGVCPSSCGPLQVMPEAAEHVERQLHQLHLERRRLVVLHYGTTWHTKLWSVENWQQLAQFLVTRTNMLPILTWGNDQELQAAQSIADATKGQAVVWPRGSIPELVALLKRVQLVVGCDTGPVHIAAAVGTPTVSLFRVTDALRNGPVGEMHCCLQAPMSCSPCLRKQCPDDDKCAASITAEEVFQAIVSLLEQPAAHPAN
ncbi:MAG: lipopolysaccharide heptosyltransferase I [Desulfuromonas sp.]|nr:lipopolysaccharide heptosyltransferase I [Desulfuromonas sp.]